jgi:hypothetical protein
MFSILNLRENQSTRVGIGDIDLYLRYGGRWDYILKCRSVQAGLRVGMLAPTGKKYNIDEPTSTPFGGNGHWGVYGAGDLLLELKEDMKLGVYVRLNKRFARTMCSRLPVFKEPLLFGAAVGEARVNPGLTVIFAPFLCVEGLRGGFGMILEYTLVEHWPDHWTDARKNQTVPVHLEGVEKHSGWGSDYVTVDAFYDTGRDRPCRFLAPIFSLRWDIPANLLIERNISRTHRVCIGVEIDF